MGQQARLVGLAARLGRRRSPPRRDTRSRMIGASSATISRMRRSTAAARLREMAPPAHLAVVAGGRRRRVLDEDLGAREHLVDRHEHQKRRASGGRRGRRRPSTRRAGVTVGVAGQRVSQFAQAAVDDRGHEAAAPARRTPPRSTSPTGVPSGASNTRPSGSVACDPASAAAAGRDLAGDPLRHYSTFLVESHHRYAHTPANMTADTICDTGS